MKFGLRLAYGYIKYWFSKNTFTLIQMRLQVETPIQTDIVHKAQEQSQYIPIVPK